MNRRIYEIDVNTLTFHRENLAEPGSGKMALAKAITALAVIPVREGLNVEVGLTEFPAWLARQNFGLNGLKNDEKVYQIEEYAEWCYENPAEDHPSTPDLTLNRIVIKDARKVGERLWAI